MPLLVMIMYHPFPAKAKTLLGSCHQTFIVFSRFAKLGDHWNLEEQVILTLEEYVCCMFGSKKKSVGTVRADMFMKNNKRENKVIDLSNMPPCFSSLLMHKKVSIMHKKVSRSAYIII